MTIENDEQLERLKAAGREPAHQLVYLIDPMTLAVYNFFGQYQQSWNLVSADILLTIIPVLVVYFLGQRFILAGLTSGSVKG